MNVGKRTEELIHVQFDLEHGHWLLQLRVVATSTIYSFGNVFEHEIEINFVLLKNRVSPTSDPSNAVKNTELTHFFTIGVEKGAEVNDIRMRNKSHDLKFTVLQRNGNEDKSYEC